MSSDESYTNMNDYHVVMIFARKKDNPEQSKSTKCLLQDLATREQIIERKQIYELIAERMNARVYVSAAPRDLAKAKKKALIRMIQSDDDVNFVRQVFGCLMQSPIKERKKFVVDIDTKEFADMMIVSSRLEEAGITDWAHVHTPNGHHFICDPFDPRIFDGLDFVEVKRDGMTMIQYLEARADDKK